MSIKDRKFFIHSVSTQMYTMWKEFRKSFFPYAKRPIDFQLAKNNNKYIYIYSLSLLFIYIQLRVERGASNVYKLTISDTARSSLFAQE